MDAGFLRASLLFTITTIHENEKTSKQTSVGEKSVDKSFICTNELWQVHVYIIGIIDHKIKIKTANTVLMVTNMPG